MVITQDVPITLLSSQQIASLTEPHLPDPRVHILLPQLKVLRPIVDRLKNISDNITIWGKMAGRLSLKIDTSTATVATDFRNLDHPAIEGRSPTHMDETVECAVKVEIKKFVRFLWAQAIQPHNAICCTHPHQRPETPSDFCFAQVWSRTERSCCMRCTTMPTSPTTFRHSSIDSLCRSQPTV